MPWFLRLQQQFCPSDQEEDVLLKKFCFRLGVDWPATAENCKAIVEDPSQCLEKCHH